MSVNTRGKKGVYYFAYKTVVNGLVGRHYTSIASSYRRILHCLLVEFNRQLEILVTTLLLAFYSVFLVCILFFMGHNFVLVDRNEKKKKELGH